MTSCGHNSRRSYRRRYVNNLSKIADMWHPCFSIERAWLRDHATSSVTAVLPPQGQRCGAICLNSFGNRTSSSDNSNDRWQHCGRCWRVPVPWKQANIWRKESSSCNEVYWFSLCLSSLKKVGNNRQLNTGAKDHVYRALVDVYLSQTNQRRGCRYQKTESFPHALLATTFEHSMARSHHQYCL